jgi:peptide/nickel transport system substrate-binding protein
LLEKNGKIFSFSLAIQGNNKLRNEIATILKDNLKQIGIDVKIDSFEPSVFVEKMFGRKFDAFISGWSVPIPVDLKPYWYSDLKNNPANTVGYRNKKADLLLDKMKSKLSSGDLRKCYFEFQRIINNDVPAVFLFWSDKIIAYNKRLSNPDFSPLGTIHYCWKWRLAN